MKVLLDENLDHRLRYLLALHEVSTARYAGFSGLKNGKLLEAAMANGFEILVTGDKTLPHEQNVEAKAIRVVVVSSLDLEELKKCKAAMLAALGTVEIGKVIRVDCGRFMRKASLVAEPAASADGA